MHTSATEILPPAGNVGLLARCGGDPTIVRDAGRGPGRGGLEVRYRFEYDAATVRMRCEL